MYPRAAANPLKEPSILTGELEPTNEGYAIAKVAIARACEYSNSQYGTRYKTIIPCNLYGLWDKFSPNNSHMVPAVIRKVYEASVARSNIVSIWGDGTARREFMFAEDLADFMLFALARLNDLPNCINVGVGNDYSISDYYKTISQVVGYRGEFEHDLTKPAGMSQKLVDTSAQEQLGWQPKTSLDVGIAKTFKYFLEECL